MGKIEWCDRTWNPTRGCSRVSEGCRNCYAERIAARFGWPAHVPNMDDISFEPAGSFAGFAENTPSGPHWTGKVALVLEKLDEPLHWRKPSRVFVNSMSDLFHEKLAPLDVARVLNIMGGAPRHTFQVLTKRPKQMKAIMDSYYALIGGERPFRNLWLGVSVEDQATADERIPLLLQTLAAVRFVSYEPALGPVDFYEWLYPKGDDVRGCLDWIIYGGESGPGARPADVAWARSTVKACREAGVPVFYKQGGAANRCPHDAKGGHLECFPADLKVREFPR